MSACAWWNWSKLELELLMRVKNLAKLWRIWLHLAPIRTFTIFVRNRDDSIKQSIWFRFEQIKLYTKLMDLTEIFVLKFKFF
ncbi:hypothetical protein BpHYR1_035898 [Brachionus plicatilis]|uniref:Uncharacterized protein n=1 Tax=Brachionus plicatilis TaxID=10195 RepID=A0A3M7SHH1_BRAPC|nr:hypothetical protein BpHYR1_035898 [Brachionus plicatilis]